MEVVRSEGCLSNAEVLELLTKHEAMKVVPSFEEHVQKLKALYPIINEHNKLRTDIIASLKSTNQAFIQQTEAAERNIEKARAEETELKSLENFVWVRSKTLSYLGTTPAATQTCDHVLQFFRKAKALCRKYRTEVMDQELLQLANHRPLEIVELYNILEDHDTRFQGTEGFLKALLELIETALPPPPQPTEVSEMAADAGEPGESSWSSSSSSSLIDVAVKAEDATEADNAEMAREAAMDEDMEDTLISEGSRYKNDDPDDEDDYEGD